MRLGAEQVTMQLGGRAVLENVSCTFPAGRLTGVIGPNGAGKSTLLKALAGLLPVSQGQVLLDDKAVSSLAPDRLARSLAYLPQDRIVHWPLPVRDIVALGRLPHRRPWRGYSVADGEIVDAAMATMDVAALAGRAVDQLSGGERARVLMARALAQQACVIVADEPVAGLDPAHALSLMQHLAALAADGRVVVVALHDLTLAARFCHDVVLLAGGRLVAQGPMTDSSMMERIGRAFAVTVRRIESDGMPSVIVSAKMA